MMTALVLICWGEIPVGGDYDELALQQFAVGVGIALGTDWCLGVGLAIQFFKKED